MKNRLFVGGLNYEVTKVEQLIQLIEEGDPTQNKPGCGKNTVNREQTQIIMDRETQQSKGYAFVEMNSETAAQEAIKNFDNFYYAGRHIRVNNAVQREKRSFGGSGTRRNNDSSYGRNNRRERSDDRY